MEQISSLDKNYSTVILNCRFENQNRFVVWTNAKWQS